MRWQAVATIAFDHHWWFGVGAVWHRPVEEQQDCAAKFMTRLLTLNRYTTVKQTYSWCRWHDLVKNKTMKQKDSWCSQHDVAKKIAKQKIFNAVNNTWWRTRLKRKKKPSCGCWQDLWKMWLLKLLTWPWQRTRLKNNPEAVDMTLSLKAVDSGLAKNKTETKVISGLETWPGIKQKPITLRLLRWPGEVQQDHESWATSEWLGATANDKMYYPCSWREQPKPTFLCSQTLKEKLLTLTSTLIWISI